MCERCLCKKAYEAIDMYYLMSLNEAKGTLQIFKNRGNGNFGMLFTEIPISYCPMCRKEAGRVNEEEIRERIEVLEARKNGYLEVGNIRQANKIQNEIYKWEDLLEKINGNLEKKVEKLENFIKSKDLWESYLHF